MNSRGRFGPVGVWLYSRGYSTDITWYFVSGCLSIVVLSLFLASQDALSNYISQESMAKVSAGIWKDGYPLLMFLVRIPITEGEVNSDFLHSFLFHLSGL
jgi:hypothetical protein